MFVILGTNTNHENTVYGPFESEAVATAEAMNMGNVDHLHIYSVLEVVEVSASEEE